MRWVTSAPTLNHWECEREGKKIKGTIVSLRKRKRKKVEARANSF